MPRASAVLLLSLLCVAGCGGGTRPGPAVAPAALDSEYDTAAVGARGTTDRPELEDILATLDAETATTLAGTASITVEPQPSAPGERVASETFSVDLLVSRSGAMRLGAPAAGFEMYSDGASLWTLAGGAGMLEDAWRDVAFVAAEPYRALSPFDLAEALLPAPWPRPESGAAALSIAEVPDGVWISAMTSPDGGVARVRRRALLSHDGARVLRRERYDGNGRLDLVVDMPTTASDPVRITKPRAGVLVSVSLISLTRDPVVNSEDFRPPR